MKEEFYMRKIGFITNIQYINESTPLIDKIDITIFDEDENKVVTITPTNFNKNYPYQLFQEVEYSKDNNSIKPYIPKINGSPDLNNKELEFEMQSIIAIMDDPILGNAFKEYLMSAFDLLLPPTKTKKH